MGVIHDKYGIDCGCENRRERLNELWSFRSKKPSELTDEEYEAMIKFANENSEFQEMLTQMQTNDVRLKPKYLPTTEMLQSLLKVEEAYSRGSQPSAINKTLYEVYNHMYGVRLKPKTCASCNRNIFNRVLPFIRVYKLSLSS